MAFGQGIVEGTGFENMVNPVIHFGNIGQGCMHHPTLDSMLIQLKIDHH